MKKHEFSFVNVSNFEFISKCLDTHNAIFLSHDFFHSRPFLLHDFCLEFTMKNAACVHGPIEITLEQIQHDIATNS